jgi:hypothetical protein
MEFFDYDPVTGITEYYEETSDGKFHIHTYQNVQPHLDAAQRLRNSGEPDAVWKRDEVSMYASLPMTIVHDMLKRGINIFDQNDMPKVLKEINSTYANFKTTYKHHAL